MNDLSWLLLLAGVLPNLATAVSVVSFLLVLIFGPIFLIYIVCRASDNRGDQKMAEATFPYRFVWAVPLCVWFLTWLVPNKETFYAIAVSEMGEEVLTSNVGNKAATALEAWLDKQITETKSPEAE